jgi:ubiquitin-conjugating enzyme (huntingtin interacting protein 2)
MLLEYPNPKDPQDAEVAKILLEDPERFARTAHEWAIRFAGAPQKDFELGKYKKATDPQGSSPAPEQNYMGYNRDLVNRFVSMGFSVQDVVDAFVYVGIDRNGGEDYELEEAYMGDITARLLGEN